MKKILCIAAFAGMFTLGYCQDVKVNINNQEATTKEECPYRINGICSTEDIGGVDVDFIAEKTEDSDIDERFNIYAVFTNYNNSPVTVLYIVRNSMAHMKMSYYGMLTENGTIGTIVLKTNGTKKVKLHSNGYGYYLSDYGINGMIVRKIQ